jgi:predicted Zn-dependent protease
MSSAQDRVRLAVALGNRARARLRIEGVPAVPEAVETLETVLRSVDPDHPSTLVALGAVLAGQGHLDRAIALTRRALEIEPARNAALVNLALYLAEDPGTRDEAVATARRAADLRPWRADAWLALARVLEKAGDFENAQQARDHAPMPRSAQ